MEILELNGEWSIQVELPLLAKLSNEKFFRYAGYKSHVANLEKGLITVDFVDERNENPDPSSEQASTLKFIIDNQQKILESILVGLKSKIYPRYLEFSDPDEYQFPPINGVDDLELALGIRSVMISAAYKEDAAYYDLNFSFSGDMEHGIVITMHHLRMISFGSDHNGKAVMTDMGQDYDKWLAEYNDNYEKNIKDRGYQKYHTPSPKYGKLKPWQKDENWLQLIALMKKNDLAKLASLIESGTVMLEEKYSSDGTLLASAVSMSNKNAVEFLLSKGAKVGNAILQCHQGDPELKTEMLQILVENGGDVDYLGYWKRTLLYYAIEGWVNAFQNMSIEKNKNPERFEKYKKDFATKSHDIEFLIGLGANPLNCDGQNSNYLTLLNGRWLEKYIAESGIEKFVNKILLNKRETR